MDPIIQMLDSKYLVVTWEGLGNDDEGTPVSLGQHSEKTVQISGNPASAVPVLEGSMDGTNYHTLTSDGSTPISGLGLFRVHENPRYIRPANSDAGGVGTAVTFTLGMSTLV